MNRTLRLSLVAGAVLLAALWTLAVLAGGWLLQQAAVALEGGSTAATLQAVTAWTERAWVRLWLEPHEADALRDGIDWLLGLGGGPAVWLNAVLTLSIAVLVMVWAGGLLLAALTGLLVLALARRLGGWWRSSRWHGAAQSAPPAAVAGHPLA